MIKARVKVLFPDRFGRSVEIPPKNWEKEHKRHCNQIRFRFGDEEEVLK